MTPYKFYLKNLLEGTGFAYDVADEDNMGFDDSDLEQDEDSMGEPGDESTEESGETSNHISKSASDAERARLVSSLSELATEVFNAYQERGIGSYDTMEQASYRLLELIEDGSPSPEALVGTMEEIGIGMNHEGIDIADADIGSFTPEMLIQMYCYSIPPDESVDRVPMPDATMLNYNARKIDEHIKGTRSNDTPVILPNVSTYERLIKSFSVRDKSVTRNTDAGAGFTGTLNTDIHNANVTHIDHVPSGRSCYFTPHAIYERVKAAMGNINALANKHNLDDLTSEYLFIGQAEFKAKYKTAPVDPLDVAMKSAGVSLSYPCYGSIAPTGEIRFGKNFMDILLVKELLPCKKGKGGIIKDQSGTPLQGMGEQLVAAVASAKKMKGVFRVKDDTLLQAIKREYMYFTKATGTAPLFDYFITNSLLVPGNITTRTVSSDDGEDNTEDHNQIALKQDEYMHSRSEVVDSGNSKLKTIDANMWARLGSNSSRKAIAALGLEQPDAKLSDEENMERITAILVAISKIFEHAGAKSRITTYDGVHPTVELDDTETGTNDSITTAWSNAISPAGGVKGVLTGVFKDASLFGMTNAMLEWVNSFAGKFAPSLHDTVSKLGMAAKFEEGIRDLTPSINIEEVIGDIIENGTDVSQDTMKYVLNYAVLTGRKIMCPFLENPRDMMTLLGYIDMKLEDEDPSADGGRSYVSQYTVELARMLKWNVSMSTLDIVPPNGNDEPDMLLDNKPADVFNWIRRKVTDMTHARESVLILIGMLEYARDMIEENDDIRQQDYLLGEDNPVYKIWTAYDRYGKTSLLKLIGEACGDSGEAIMVLWNAINSRNPIDDAPVADEDEGPEAEDADETGAETDGKSALEKIEDAVRVLATVSGITFNVDTSDTTGQDD